MTTTARIPKDLNAAAEQVSEVNERLIKASKRAGSRYLEATRS